MGSAGSARHRPRFFRGLGGGGVTYADATAPTTETPTVEWNHPLGDVVTALASAGLRIRSLRELDHDVLHQ